MLQDVSEINAQKKQTPTRNLRHPHPTNKTLQVQTFEPKPNTLLATLHNANPT